MKKNILLSLILLISQSSQSSIIELKNPTVKSLSSIEYKFNEIKTLPGDELIIHIPEEYKKQPLSFIILGHRQDPNNTHGATKAGEQDSIPGLSSVLVHAFNQSENNQWRYWNGMASGQLGAKFAEIRSSPEIENLYNWNSIGSCSLINQSCHQELLLIDQVKIKNVGQDEVLVSQLTIKFIPQNITDSFEKIFSPGTEFSLKFGEKAHLGGGQNSKGLFPQALVINNSIFELDIPDGYIIKGIEVAAGDSHSDEKINSDGGWGVQGWAKMSVGIGQKRNSIQWLTRYENVPPEGVLLAFPFDEKVTNKTKLFVEGSSDLLYIMGIKISLSKVN